MIQNPIINTPRDPFVDLSVLVEKLGRDEACAIALRHADYIQATDNWDEIAEEGGFGSVEEFISKHPERLGDLYFNAFQLFDDALAVAVLRARGYDGGIYGGYGDNRGDVEYRVLDPIQVQPITAQPA